MRKYLIAVASFIFGIVFFLFPFFIVIHQETFFFFLQEKTGVTSDLGEEATKIFTQKVFQFIYGEAGQGELVGFSSAERIHLQEIQEWYLDGMKIFLAFFFFSILIFLFFQFNKKRRKMFFQSLLVASLANFMTLFLLAFFVLLNFEFSFRLFHQVLFVYTWQFTPESLLIRLFPYEFFVNIARAFLIFQCLVLTVVFFVAVRGSINNQDPPR